MTWLVHPTLVNEPFSDPGLFMDSRFGRRALLFDLGDVSALSPRQLLRVTHCFVSHTHMDHFAGFDRLLRVCLHRMTPLHLIGPAGFADRVEHKLRAYTLNLLDMDSVDFVITAAEFSGTGAVVLARDADQLFIEAPFLDTDANIAAQRRHLTARQAGEIGRRAHAGRVVPFHFSARYLSRADELRREVEEAFRPAEPLG